MRVVREPFSWDMDELTIYAETQDDKVFLAYVLSLSGDKDSEKMPGQVGSLHILALKDKVEAHRG